MSSAPMTISPAQRSVRSANSSDVPGWCTCQHTSPNRPNVLRLARAHPRHIFEVTSMLERSISRWVRADAAVLLVITLWAVTITNTTWIWFGALFLVPDLSMIGYVFGARVGAAYNARASVRMASRLARSRRRVSRTVGNHGGAELDRAHRLRQRRWLRIEAAALSRAHGLRTDRKARARAAATTSAAG